MWTTRLLTLTGPGGYGKTRLALTVAGQLLDAFQDSVWFVELAALSGAALIPRTIMMALGMHEQMGNTFIAALIEQLHPRELLLVLDNCEHMIDGCAFGGAIASVLLGNVQLLDSVFHNNATTSATSGGGAICTDRKNAGQLR